MRRMNVTLPLTLPEDLIREILMRLPVRSILRFKSVCKSWLSLISDPEFIRSHFALDATPTDRLFLSVNNYQVDCTDIEASLHDNSAKVVFNFPLPSPDDKYGCMVDIVGSCRGFILLLTDGVFDFIIWNPSTGLRKGISSYVISMDGERVYLFDADRCGFGYDSSTDDYVIVNLTSEWWCTLVHYFSLRTSSWSRIILDTVQYFPLCDRHGVLLNGALHWLVRPCVTPYDHHQPVIISFDVTERRLSEIPLPHNFTIIGQEYDLSVMGGCLCVAEMGYGTAIWTMKQYKVHSSWTKLFVPLYNQDHPFLLVFYPICSTKKGEFLGSNHKTLVKLNDKGELLEHHAHWHNMDSCILLRCGVYRESLLSLPE